MAKYDLKSREHDLKQLSKEEIKGYFDTIDEDLIDQEIVIKKYD